MPKNQARIEIDGLKPLQKALKNAGADLVEMKGAGLAAAEIVSSEAKGMAPVLSGSLVASIRPAGQASGGVVRAGSGSVQYAKVIHFGWPQHSIQPHPFLYDAVDARAGEIEELYLQRLQEIADKIGDST